MNCEQRLFDGTTCGRAATTTRRIHPAAPDTLAVCLRHADIVCRFGPSHFHNPQCRAELAGICTLHASSAGHAAGQCSRCDECGHEDASHAEDYIEPTCWAQARCVECATTADLDWADARMAQSGLEEAAYREALRRERHADDYGQDDL